MSNPAAVSGDKIACGVAAAMALAGVALFVAPGPILSVAPFDRSTGDKTTQGAEDALPEAAETNSDLSFGDYFDHASLPAPVAPEPQPPDPAAALKRYRYVGNAAADGRQKALFEADGSVYSLSVGDELAGFVLTAIQASAATFAKDEIIAQLPLGAPQ